MERFSLIRRASALLVLVSAGEVAASVDRSPPPGGVYRLKPGVFVKEGVACSSAPNVAIRRYDGHGISTAHTRACRAHVISRRGDRLSVSQSCISAGAGRAPRTTERQVVRVIDALTFIQVTGGPGATYRYCPASMLPYGIRATEL